MVKIITFLILSFCFANLVKSQTETFGSVSMITQIAGYMGFSNNQVVYSGTGDIRNTSMSNGYTNASGGANIFLTSNKNSSLTISSIDVLNGATDGQLCFGIYKSTTASNGSELIISATNANINSPFSLPTGTGTANWRYVCLDLTFTSNNISISFTNTSGMNGVQFRLDDISLSNSILPIKLQSFLVSKINKTSKLSWSTSYEKSCSHFLIQRSQDGNSFQTIGQVSSVSDSRVTNEYSFIDEQPKKGNNYYRLVQVDLDGTKKTYKTEMVHIPYEQGFVLVNTIVDQENTSLQLSSDVEKYQVSIFDISGQKVIQMQNATYDQLIDTKDLAKGIYIAHCEGNGEVSTLRFVKK